MANPEEASKAPETTPPTDWIIPNQAFFEQVIDQRLEAHKSAEKPAHSRARTAAAKDEAPKDPKDETPKS